MLASASSFELISNPDRAAASGLIANLTLLPSRVN
jgi:hypothetical protein